MLLSAAVVLALPFVQAAPWAQPVGAPAHDLFKRQGAAATTYPAVGEIPPLDSIPQAWLDKLKSVSVADVPISTVVAGTDNQVTYPPGTALQSPEVCAFTTGCMRDDDINGLPESVFGLTFDDGPGTGTTLLSDFLESKQMSSHATHFFIGGQIVRQEAGFNLVFGRGGHIAGHTWSHPRLTSRTNEEIVAELGWTMQIIYDKTGGRIPQFWRPPFGDLDERVRDIAKNVFGLRCVLWNSDTNDWKIAAEGKGPVEEIFEQWATGPKTVGHSVLMHEINVGTIEVFISKYDVIEKNGWKFQNVAESVGLPMYANSADNKADVQEMSIIEAADLVANSSDTPSTGGSTNPTTGVSTNPSASGPATSQDNVTPSAGPNNGASALAPGVLVSAIALFVAALI